MKIDNFFLPLTVRITLASSILLNNASHCQFPGLKYKIFKAQADWIRNELKDWGPNDQSWILFSGKVLDHRSKVLPKIQVFKTTTVTGRSCVLTNHCSYWIPSRHTFESNHLSEVYHRRIQASLFKFNLISSWFLVKMTISKPDLSLREVHKSGSYISYFEPQDFHG